MTTLFILVAFLFGAALYFLPTILAWLRKKSNLVAIFVMNLLLGWLFVGWVIALVWALSNDSPTTQTGATGAATTSGKTVGKDKIC
ncbi:superinfection immunity protein [Acidithiobacillus caldus]|uniref:Superinfection immunity protein n=1 Tax=Acidithiobacillus caldus TaxID=33059 RepID=B1A4L2_9PROT|nr:superinfection immunity protein [Acidithiobacillus caldus]ACA00190.1 unknown [Acidithiobacillus caldus]